MLPTTDVSGNTLDHGSRATDLAARSLAEAGGLPLTGTLGCLVEAKRRGWIDSVNPLLQALRQKARFWISREFEEAVLKDPGEV